MRLIKVSAPEGRGADVMRVAFSVGIERISFIKAECHHSDGRIETRDIIDIETSTPRSKHFVDSLLQSDFFDRNEYSVTLREPRSIFSDLDFNKLTVPMVAPITDIFEELFQFSHLTIGFAGRTFVAGCLLSYGMIQQQFLLIVAGLLFLPILPLLLSVGFGTWTKRWQLAANGLVSFSAITALLVAGGILVAAISHPPLRYNDFSSMFVSFMISVVVGAAAGLSTIDDVGRRELIGLAASSQLAIIPAWLGISIVFGFPPTESGVEIAERIISFFLNAGTIVVTALIVYILTCGINASLEKRRKNAARDRTDAKSYPHSLHRI
jgi:hypothetical protein